MQLRTLSKKILAISLSVAMLLTCMVWSGVSAATGEIDYGFEEMPKYSDGTDYYNDTNGSGNNMNRNGHSALRRNVGEGTAYEGSYVMELKSTAAITSGYPYVGPAFRVTDMDDALETDGYAPAKGSYVRIRFRYNVQSVTTAGKTSRLVALSNSRTWSGTNNQSTAGVTLATFTGETATNGQWVQVDAICRITDTNRLHLGMQHDVGAAGATVWLDDLTVVTVAPVNVTLDPNYDGATAVTDLAEQNSTYAPAYVPARAGYTFVGWYTDAACTAAYTGTVGDADITLYARWGKTGEIDYGFEEMPKYGDGTDYYNDTNGSGNNMNRNGHSAFRQNVGEDAAYEGSYVMELKSTAAITSGYPYVGPAFRVTDMDDALETDGYKPAVGTYVRIRFRYNVQSVTTAGKTSRLVAHSASKTWGTPSGGSNNQGAAGMTLATFSSETATNGQWVQVDAIYQITDTNRLHLGMQHDVGAAGATVWLDDLSVVPVDGPTGVTVTLDPNYEGGTAVTETAEKNSTFAPAYIPERAGYTFTGWYTDAACTAAYTGTVGEAAVTLYAKWEKSTPENVSLVQDFEAVSSANEFKMNTEKPFVLAEGTSCGTGQKALKATINRGYQNNYGRPIWALQMNGDTSPLKVTPNAPATVTFSLMAQKDVSTVTFWLGTVNDLNELSENSGTASAANVYRTMQTLRSTSLGSRSNSNREVTGVTLEAGKWTTVTVEIDSITAHETGDQYMVLAITDTRSGNESFESYDLCIDDVKVDTQVGGDTVNVTYNTTGGDELAPGTGIIWSSITATATRSGYEFDGWYTDETLTTAITTYPPQESVTLYAGWRPAGASEMTFEVDADFTPTLYADMDLDDEAVRAYYSGSTNMTKTAETTHAIVSDAEQGLVISATVGEGADSSSRTSGFRIVGKGSTAKGYSVEKGQTYSVTFRYKVEALPVTTEIRVLEGSINWQGYGYNSRTDHEGFDITAADVGAGWKTGSVNFVSELGGGVHLALHASDYTQRSGTVVYFDEVKVRSYQQETFTTTGDAVRVEGEQNVTPGGKAALKVTTDAATAADTDRVVYAGGVGDKRFATNTVNVATAWLYADRDTEATLQVYSEPDLTRMGSITDRNRMGEQTVTLQGGRWTRVQAEFVLSDLADEAKTYLSLGVATDNGTVVYMDDISIGVYNNDPTKVQTYEELDAGEHPNSPRMDGKLHGLYGNTVVTGKGYDGSSQSLQISMRSDKEQSASRAVLFPDKMDATAAVNGGYIVTFYAMAEEDLEVNFGLGTSDTVDISEPDMYANAAENSTAVSMKAGQWTAVSVSVDALQGKNPELCMEPYITLAAWFEGAAADNVKNVYIDNVRFQTYSTPAVAQKNTLCFENTEVFGFGAQPGLNGGMEVVLDQNHTTGGYYSLKVVTTNSSGVGRPQIDLTDANGKAIRVEKGVSYKVSFWIYFPKDAEQSQFRYWLAVTDKTDAYTADTNQQRIDEQVKEANYTSGTKGGWKQVTVELTDIPRDGYVRLGICGTETFYLDDIKVLEQRTYELTGEETVLDYENYNLEDGDFIRNGTGYVSDEQNHTDKGGKSLKLIGTSREGAKRNQLIVIDPATHLPYEFTPGNGYTLTFWMYSSSEYTDEFQVNAWIWGTDDPAEVLTGNEKNEKNGTFEWDGGLAPVTHDGYFLPDEWNQISISFTAKNGKHMLMGITDNAMTGGSFVYYLDDMSIEVMEAATVTFDANGGSFDDTLELNDKGQYVVDSFISMYVEAPGIDPYKEGKKFMGWALDKDGKQVFDLAATPVDKTALTLYAIWGNWTNEDGFTQIDKTDRDDADKDEIKYRTEIQYEKVWTGNATIPLLELGEPPLAKDAPPVTAIPQEDTDTDPSDSVLPVWLIIVIIVAAVVVVGGGAILALLLLKKKESDDKEAA